MAAFKMINKAILLEQYFGRDNEVLVEVKRRLRDATRKVEDTFRAKGYPDDFVKKFSCDGYEDEKDIAKVCSMLRSVVQFNC